MQTEITNATQNVKTENKIRKPKYKYDMQDNNKIK